MCKSKLFLVAILLVVANLSGCSSNVAKPSWIDGMALNDFEKEHVIQRNSAIAAYYEYATMDKNYIRYNANGVDDRWEKKSKAYMEMLKLKKAL